MKILHIISQHPESTGSGIYLQNIIRQAAAAGHQNYLVAGISGKERPQLDCIGEKQCKFLHFNTDEINFLIPGMSDVMPYPSSTFKELSSNQLNLYQQGFSSTISQAIRDFSPDIIHSHHLWLVSAITQKVCGDLPMVSSCHSTDLRQFEQCPHLRNEVLAECSTIPAILALSHDQKAKISSLYGIVTERIDIVGGGYDKTLFRHYEKGPAEPVQLLYAGKLSFAKGVDWLLSTFLKLQDQGLHLHLAGSGSGEEAERCLELAQKGGATVTVHGKISQQKLAQLMGQCHIFILPSFYEGLPLVLLEGLACGCRVITTDLPGCRELLAGADEELVDFIPLPIMESVDRPREQDFSELEAQLAGAIITMGNRTRLSPSPSIEARRRLTSPFSWEEVFRKISLSYEKAVGENS